jgi:diaminohydroxyphosphoribosylaminopyrimidine deaminase/5-amino-6-(5-phosphoribosylamino)uracil reductase
LRSRLGGSWPGQPARIIVDSRARLGQSEGLLDHLAAERGGGAWIVACGKRAPSGAVKRLEDAGARIWPLPDTQSGSGIDLHALAVRMAHEGLLDVLVEGGATLATELVRQELVDRYRVFLAPAVLGGSHTWTGDLGVRTLSGAHRLAGLRARRLGDDLLITAYSPAAAGRLAPDEPAVRQEV